MLARFVLRHQAVLHIYFYSILRFCEGNFVGEMESTIGVDFYLSEIDVDGKKIKVS